MLLSLFAVACLAQNGDPQATDEPLAAFCKRMSGVELVGRFTTDQAAGRLREDRYRIESIKPLRDDLYVVTSRIAYRRAGGESIDLTVPVTVRLHLAGELPVLSVRDLSIPLLGDDFSSAIVFDGDRYAGTWAHGPVGGHMWGRIEQAGDAEGSDRPDEPPATETNE